MSKPTPKTRGRKPPRGSFVTFEGTEGAGKSTLIAAFADLLRSRGRETVTTREPGGSSVAEKIRAVILNEPMHPWTEAFLYEAARAEHLNQTIRPALERGAIVLCDRFTDSTLAYQGAARGLDWNTLRRLNDIATDGLKPKLTVFVDIDPGRGLRDAKDPNRFEAEGVAFQTKVRKGFLRAMREEPKRFVKVTARSGTPETMAAELLGKIGRRIGVEAKTGAKR
ncbi:MAG: dTMP kinase [Bdellovibrionales bacterium]|nr:dTMP kinase [Bdellovibrionales bacterium]